MDFFGQDIQMTLRHILNHVANVIAKIILKKEYKTIIIKTYGPHIRNQVDIWYFPEALKI